MTQLHMLLLPIFFSSVLVFLVSSVIHMFSPWHKGDYPKLHNEDKVMDALRSLDIAAGEYMAPRPSSRVELSSPEFAEKRNKGPVFILNVFPKGQTGMVKNLVGWFLYTLVMSIFGAYISGRALPFGAMYLHVFRFVGASTFLGYSAALWQMSIWYNRPWSTTIKATVDGLIYALLTAGMFGWLWPR